MEQLDRFAIPGKECLVCKLNRVSMGPKKLLDSHWYKKFDAFILSHGFKSSNADHALCTKKDVGVSSIILMLYVYVMLIAGKRTTLNARKD